MGRYDEKSRFANNIDTQVATTGEIGGYPMPLNCPYGVSRWRLCSGWEAKLCDGVLELSQGSMVAFHRPQPRHCGRHMGVS